MRYLGFLKVLQLATIIVLELGLLVAGGEAGCIERERAALLQFKAGIVDHYDVTRPWSSWGSQSHDCCVWEGVVCNNQTGHVEVLNLHGDDFNFLYPLKGEISSSLMELQHLMYFNLSLCTFRDTHFPQFFPYLTNLRYLNLYECNFIGNIPSQLGSLSHLRYLDLGHNRLEGSIPYQLENLSQLQYLSLTWNNLGGAIPHQLGNLSNLQHLRLGGNGMLKIDHESGGGGEWLSTLTSLTHLKLSNIINLKYSHKWLQMISKLPSLKDLDLSFNDLSDHYFLPLTPLEFNSSHSLSVILLSDNNFTSSKIFQWLSSVIPNLVDLDLSFNILVGPIPNEFGHICTLRSLFLSYNYLSQDLPTILQNLSRGCVRYSLQELDLSNNYIIGTLPDLSAFVSLKTLDLSSNQLNGTIPKDYQFPSQLESLYIYYNSLKGTLTDSHFANMTNLRHLDLSNNSFALRFSHNWVPLFQLETIFLGYCKLGPSFPNWLQKQSNFTRLYISNAGISDTIPEWFWGLLSPELKVLDVSYNNLRSTIPNFPKRFFQYPTISLVSNQFEGPIPQFLRQASHLDLSSNKFSELHMFLCSKSETEILGIFNLSNNQLSGQLPDCWSHFTSLLFLDLSNNNLSGTIPASVGSLHKLKVLILRNNQFIGKLPLPLMNLSNLEMLDAGENKFSGPIPSWIGSGLHVLKILILRNNHFSGSLPSYLCYVTSIQVLDLSLNSLSGQIPKCFKNFTAMAQESSSYLEDGHYFIVKYKGLTYRGSYDLIALLMWKGVEQKFKNTNLLLNRGIDLSCNQLTGEIPVELGSLIKLTYLNFSRNHLTGEIPSEIGQLTSLDFLDLSRNYFFGSIPSSLAHIDRLGVLDLSHNNLSGKIPIGTQLQSFNESSYEDNFDLCGEPLKKKCLEDEKPIEPVNSQESKHSHFSKEFYWSMALGFFTGFWGIFGSILLSRSWRHVYFRFLSNLTDTIYVMAMVNANKFKRCLQAYLA